MTIKKPKKEDMLDLFRQIEVTPFRILVQAKTLFLSYKCVRRSFTTEPETDLLTSCIQGKGTGPAFFLLGFALENL
jgi:hypothetical protein